MPNPYFFQATSAIGKEAGLKFLPDITHHNRDWTAKEVNAALAIPNSVIEFKQWKHIDLFKHSNRKKVIILDRFEPHDHLRLLRAEVVYKLDARDYYPRPPVAGIDYSWADLIICIQEEIMNGPDWINFLNDPGSYFGTSSGRVISIVAGAVDDIRCNAFPYNVLRVPLNLWCAWTAAVNHEVEYNPELSRPYRFEALLGGAKENRKFLFDRLRNSQLLKSGLVSISAQTYVSPTDRVYHDVYYRTLELDHYDNPDMVAMREQTRNGSWVGHTVQTSETSFPIGNGKTIPIKPYGSFFIPHKVYQNSWFSIIAESIVNCCDFFTEKTAKVLFGRRIFVTFGPQHSLKAIRDAGFKTFSPWINESYDDEPDDEKRWSLAFEQVVKLVEHPRPWEIYTRANSVLEHNYQLISNSKLMLGPIDDFIQSFLNGTALPDPVWKPIKQKWSDAQIQVKQLKQLQNLDLPNKNMKTLLAPPHSGALPNFAVTNSDQLCNIPSHIPQQRKPLLTNVDIANSNRLFNDPEILDALEQARAATRARRSG